MSIYFCMAAGNNNLDERTKLMLKILDVSKRGINKEELEKMLGLSHQQIRRITAELSDKGFLRYVGEGRYMTADDGYKFMYASSAASHQNTPSNKEMNDSRQ